MDPQQVYQNGQINTGAGAPQVILPGQQPIMPNQGMQGVPMMPQGMQGGVPGMQGAPMMQNMPNMQSLPTMQGLQSAQGQVQNAQNMQNLGSAAIAAQQAAPASPNKDVPTSTQATLMISEMRDDVVIMKDGSFRAVVACKSINFDLMSEMEREAVELSYQGFLNSLNFTTQILIRSQKVDIGPYVERLLEVRRTNDNMLLGVLMDDYIAFIDDLAQGANIMDKSFFVVIPYYTSADTEKVLLQTKNFFKSFSKAKAPEITRIDRATYEKALTEINNRVDAVMDGLFQIGVQSIRLKTRELAELYYNFNNPDTAVREPLVDFSKLATLYVKKGQV